ncbi:MAG: cofactor assembly of complex C subunit B [Gemmatimonadaceae bacterium]|nr:cofactor assembly of complex C subunit B [Gloeobacterales cyanobacterium ES-bin-141]
METLLRNLPIAVGILGSTLLVLNRFLSAEPTPAQTRADALGLAMSAVLVLVGLLWQQVKPKPPTEVPLEGIPGFELAEPALPWRAEFELLSSGLLEHTPSGSILVWWDDLVLLRSGRLGILPPTLGTIAQRVLKTQRPVYLVDLRLFPGRAEFDYLPAGTQALVCQPLARGLLVVGSGTPRSFSPADLGWIDTLAKYLSTRLGRLPTGAGD